MELTSPEFSNGSMIPARFTCEGADISPELQWHDVPADTQSYVLIVDDPDAPSGTWDHWIVFNIPGAVHELNEGIHQLPQGALGGANSWKKDTYGGPCPPSGTHRYFFKLYALDNTLNLPQGSSKSQIETAMMGHILAESSLMGKFERN